MTTDAALSRLRAGNPFPAATAVDADRLLDRITALAEPPTPRFAARRRPVLVVALGLVLAAVVASGAYGISSWIGDVIGPSAVSSEYAHAQEQLTLPPGYGWPALNWPKNAVTSRGGGASFAVSIDQSAWECYWAFAIKHGDRAAERKAQAALRDLMKNHIVVAPDGASENWAPAQSPDKPTLAYADDGGYEYKQRIYAEAAAGKPGLLEQSCRVNGPAKDPST
jgi:hypothetical protein